MRLIDADALGDEFDKMIHYLKYEVDKEDNPARFEKASAINWCRNTLNDAPEINPVKHLEENGYTVSKKESWLESKPCNSCQNDIIYCFDCKRLDEWIRKGVWL